MNRYEVHITLHTDQSPDELAETIMTVLPDNAALSMKRIEEEEDM